LALMRADARAPTLLALFPLALMWADARAPTLLAIAPSALVRADARAPTLLALFPLALMGADARASALFACAPYALVRADARASALLALAPLALVRADARSPTLLAITPLALVRADARAPALLASAPSALMRALRALLLWRSAALLVVFDPIAFIAARLFLLGDTVSWLRHQPPLTALLPLGRPATLLRLDWRWSLIPRCTAHFPQSQDSPACELLAGYLRGCDCLKVLLGGADGVSQSPT
jgi:hypothetical protein